MWSDNDIDTAFQRLNPPEPEPTPFPLDAWLRLETQLDQAVIAREVRRKLWRFFAAEVAVVALVALGWLLWPAGKATPAVATAVAVPAAAGRVAAPGSAGTAGARNASEPARQRVAATATRSVSKAGVATSKTPTTAALAAGKKLMPEEFATPAAPAARPGRALGGAPVLAAAHSAETSQNTGRNHAESQHFGHARLAVGSSAHPTKPDYARRLASENVAGAAASAGLAGAGAAPRPRAAAAGAGRDLGSASVGRPTGSAPGAPASAARTAATSAAEPRVAAVEPLAPQPIAVRPGAAAALPTPLATLAVAAPTPGAPTPARQPRFYLGLVGAADVTTVKFASVQSPLPNVGLVLEYRLTDRLRLTTGLLRATKQYAAHREDYDFGAYSTRVYQRNFKNVDGACTVLDVPLNLRYAFVSRPQYQFFGSVGLSSFFMQRERYTYDYMENNLPHQWEGSAVNQNRHLFSIFNLSAGYERNLSRRWSLQAEPYLKLPLSGVGLGKVRLLSAGVFLGVKYGF